MINHNLKHLLATTLREKSGSYVIEEIFTRFPSLPELLDATEKELVQIPGLGPAKASAVISALQLARAINAPMNNQTIIRSPEDVFHYVKDDIMYEQREHFLCLFLNTKNAVISKEIISIGSLSAAIVHPREVFRIGCKRSAASIICCHQHPSGDPSPSPEDIQLTKRLVEAGELLGISVLDHIIIGYQRHLSLKEQGYM